MIDKIFILIKKRKYIFLGIVLVIISGGYYLYKSKNVAIPVQYITSKTNKGTLTRTVTATGQVSSFNQVDLKTQVSGTVKNVVVAAGLEVKAGSLIAEIDSQDAYKSVRDAEISLESAKLSLDKIKAPADTLSVLQAENSLSQAKQARLKADDDLIKAYEDGFNSIANAYLDMPTVVSDLYNTLYSRSIAESEPVLGQETNIFTFINFTGFKGRDYIKTFSDSAEKDYKIGREKYDKNFLVYKNITRFSSRQEIDSLLLETLDAAKALAQAVKSETNFLDAWVDYRNVRDQEVFANVVSMQKTLSTDMGKINSHISSMLTISRTIQTTKEAIINTEQAVAEKIESLAKLKAGADLLDIQSQELSLKQKQNILQDAREKLADYFIRAPFDGVVGKVSVKKSDEASSGTILATLITDKKIAEVSLNEVDIAKITVGQKVVLTFDAIEKLDFTGQVMEVDAIGTISQGVVSYGVKIVLDIQDERVKPGMSVSANIITNVKQDALIVPSSAVKSQAQTSYVEVLENGNVKRVDVEVGLSNDSETEIIFGVKEGDEVITQTVNTAKQTQQTNSALPIGGGAFRALGR